MGEKVIPKENVGCSCTISWKIEWIFATI